MSPQRRRILLFAAQFLLVFSALATLYSRVLPVYEKLVISVANFLLANLSPLARIVLEPSGQWHADLEHGARKWSVGIGSSEHAGLLFLNLIILPALLLATPVRTRERIRLLGKGLTLLVGIHVLSVSACVYGLGLLEHPGGFLGSSLPSALRLGAQGVSIALWGLLTWRYWFPDTLSATKGARRAGPRNEPCPCGSGRKYKWCCGLP